MSFIFPNDILREIFMASDIYTQATLRSCCKLMYTYKYTTTFAVYSVNSAGIHIAYNTSRRDRVRYHCVGDIQIWTLYGELPPDIVAWYICDRLIIRNKKTGYEYKDLLFYTHKEGENKQVNLDGKVILTWNYICRDDVDIFPITTLKIYTLPTNPITRIEIRTVRETGECLPVSRI